MSKLIRTEPLTVKEASDNAGNGGDDPFKVYFLKERSEKQREEWERFLVELKVKTLIITCRECVRTNNDN